MTLETTVLLFASLGILVYASDFFVQGSQRIGKKLHISDFILGVTLIAIGTTIPELASGVVASLQNNSALVWGDIVGSNIANIGMVLGLAILLTKPADIQQKFFKSDLLALVLFTTLFVAFGANNEFSLGEGFILFLLLLAYLAWLVQAIEHSPSRLLKAQMHQHVQLELNGLNSRQRQQAIRDALGMTLGILGIWLGAEWTVHYAVQLATEFSISPTIIGITILAVGTSLPNLFVAVSALKRNLGDVFLGSIIGANIATIGMVGGIAMLINPIRVAFEGASTTYSFLIISTIALFVAGWIHPKITKATAFAFLALWILFLTIELNNPAFLLT